MTHPNQETAADGSPEGLIFLPRSIRGLENFKLELMLGRGTAIRKSLAEIEDLYEAANRELDRRRALIVHAGHVAVAARGVRGQYES